MPVQPSYVRDIERWRERRVADLKRRWLSIVGMTWLEEGTITIGSDPANGVVLPKGPPHVGTINVQDGTVTIAAAQGSGLTHDGTPVATLVLRDDGDPTPTVLRLRSLSLTLHRWEDRLAIRIRDDASPAVRAFRGIDYFPIDPAWRLPARFEAHHPPRVVEVPSVLGTPETRRLPGVAAFDVGGETYRLETFEEAGTTDLFIVFGDRTNRADTYEGGRYVYARPPASDGTVTLDFNRAYNPPCVFSPFTTCSLPLPENRLPFRIEAGERRYRAPEA
jgi:uncharacterized protein (DUF1684 family)